ncbi:hypothetical protein GII33_18085 [Gordonia pseudamarae]|jgi:hypothetical protein|uniref:Uncharacterized protein n=1 Tax=Gordonia pseudamarae TaxID=2831662 RepID=A0ABX6IKQ4_9ACTN|nr:MULTISPECIES: hypothetical protein [Gordonia]MBD0021228.1 hypothetical protein [Gordonia sp. (in: high G+C Gram-positive bacteria)]QHN27592.1 hypothetical protein GII33_18085 [Gordonia pseudamarae]QHN36474.1 hypothetical protein GII31_17860 [Gordonia pseudamarae]
MYRRFSVAVMALLMAIGLAGWGAAQAVAAPSNHGNNNGRQVSNKLDITVSTTNWNSWRGPEVTITTRWGRYVAGARQVDRYRDHGRTTFRYVARDLPWNTPLKVSVSGGRYYGDNEVYFERTWRDRFVTESVYLRQGGGRR